jgi:hypothetical protein
MMVTQPETTTAGEDVTPMLSLTPKTSLSSEVPAVGGRSDEGYLDCMTRSRLGRGGRGAVDAPKGKFGSSVRGEVGSRSGTGLAAVSGVVSG